MSEFFNSILVSVSRLLFSSPAFVKIAERALSGARQVQDSSGELSSSSLDEVVPISDNMNAYKSPPLFEAVSSSHDAERPLDLGILNERSGITLASLTLGSKSATGDPSLGDSTSPIISEPHYPPSDSDDDILALYSSSLSLESDNSVDDDFNLDTLLLSACSIPTPPRVSGLGISGLTRKDGSGPFDGLGVVSVKPSAWRHDNLPSEMQLGDGIDFSESIQGFRQRPSSFSSSSAYDGSSDSEASDPSLLIAQGDRILSDVFLQETLLTFTEDPCHELCHSNVVSSSSIPDCDNNNSWSELDLGNELTSTSASISEFKLLVNTTTPHSAKDSRPQLPIVSDSHRRRAPKLNINFTSATISSELKRSSTITIPKNNWRNRSSSWPCGATEDSPAMTPLSRCKWRL